MASKIISLKSKNNDYGVVMNIGTAPFMGIWAKPNADYVCFEPWHGVGDEADASYDFTEKKGIIALEANKIFDYQYTVTIQ